MKFPKILLIACLLFLVSCDKNGNEEAIEALSGHWHIWNYEPSADSPLDESILAKESILKLVKESCDPIEFSFYSDGTVIYANGMRYLDVSMIDDEVAVECASQYDEKRGAFDFDYSKLTLKFDSETITFEAALEDEYFTTEVDDMLINGVEVSGKLYFIRETGH